MSVTPKELFYSEFQKTFLLTSDNYGKVFVPTPMDLSAASEGKMITCNILLHSYEHNLGVQR